MPAIKKMQRAEVKFLIKFSNIGVAPPPDETTADLAITDVGKDSRPKLLRKIAKAPSRHTNKLATEIDFAL